MKNTSPKLLIDRRNDPFSDLLWQENQEYEKKGVQRHPLSTLTADIERYFSSTH